MPYGIAIGLVHKLYPYPVGGAHRGDIDRVQDQVVRTIQQDSRIVGGGGARVYQHHSVTIDGHRIGGRTTADRSKLHPFIVGARACHSIYRYRTGDPSARQRGGQVAKALEIGSAGGLGRVQRIGARKGRADGIHHYRGRGIHAASAGQDRTVPGGIRGIHLGGGACIIEQVV